MQIFRADTNLSPALKSTVVDDLYLFNVAVRFPSGLGVVYLIDRSFKVAHKFQSNIWYYSIMDTFRPFKDVPAHEWCIQL